MSTRPTLADVQPANEDDAEGSCGICGDDIEVGQRTVWVPAGYGPKNMILCVHLWCAVKEDEIDLRAGASGGR